MRRPASDVPDWMRCLSVRAGNCLFRCFDDKWPEAAEVAKLRPTDLLKLPNFGRHSLLEVSEALARLGLGLNAGDGSIWVSLEAARRIRREAPEMLELLRDAMDDGERGAAAYGTWRQRVRDLFARLAPPAPTPETR